MTRAAASTRAAPGPAARLPRPARAFPRRLALIAALAVASAPVSWAQEALARPTVGMRARVDGVAVPGPLLVARPLEPRAALVVRVLAARRTADGHVYDLDFYGLEPGRYDLSTALVREDGAPARLPPIPVEVLGVLKPGQVLPHALAADRLPRPGGYAALLGSAVALWLGCGGALVVLGRRRRRAPDAPSAAPAPDLAGRLRPLAEAAVAGRLDARGQADLERLLVGHWAARLPEPPGEEPAERLRRLRAHPEAGALLRALDEWLHVPPARRRAPDLEALLAPYRGQA